MADLTVTLRINADGTAAVQAIGKVSAASKTLGSTAAQSGQEAAQGFKLAGQGAAAMELSVDRARSSVMAFAKGLASAFVGMQAATAVAGMADTWSDLSSRVQLSIGPHQEAADVMDRISDIARQTYSSLELTGEGFASNAVTLNALGKSTQQQLDYMQALNNALVVSGARADRAVMVQNSLSKALAVGALRGEELNNVLSFGGRIAELLADELGTNVTQLRQLSAEGQITGDVLFNALTRNMEQLTREAEEMPATIGDAFTLMRNAVLQSVGVFDQQAKISQGVAEALIVVADHVGTLIKLFGAAATLIAGRYLAGLAAAVLAKRAAQIEAVRLAQAELAGAKAAEAAAAAQMAKAAAMRAAGLGAAQAAAAENALAAAQARTTAAATAANAAAAARVGILARMGRGAVALAGGPIGVAAAAMGGLVYALHSVIQAEQARQAQFDAGLAESAKRAVELAERVRDVADEIQALNAIPVGQMAPTLATYAEAIEHVVRDTAALARTENELAAAHAQLEVVQKVAAAGLDHMGVATRMATRRVKELTDERDNLVGTLSDVSAQADRLGASMTQLRPGIDAAGQALSQLANLSSVREVPGVLDSIRTAWGNMVASMQIDAQAGAALAAFRSQVAQASQAIEEARVTSAQYRAEQQELVISTAIASGASAEYVAALREEFAAGNAILAQAAALGGARSSQASAERELTRARDEAARAAEQFARIEQDMVDQAADMAAALSGPAAVAQREYEKAIRDVREQMDALDAAQRDAKGSTLDLTAAKKALATTEAALATQRDHQLTLIARERDVVARLGEEHAQHMMILGMSEREYAIYQARTEAVERATDELGNTLEGVPDSLDAIGDAAARNAAQAYDLTQHLADLDEVLRAFGDDAFSSPILDMVDGIQVLRAEIERLSDPMSDAFDPEKVAQMQRAVDRMTTQLQIQTLGSYQALLGAAQAFQKEGSSGFRAMESGIAALSIVQDALALRAAVTAVLSQGQGDPYSAWARMAAMAAAVAPFLASIGQTLAGFGGGGGGGGGAPPEHQAIQGTGTVLGDSAAKSESILRATEITADATKQLVGINRGMLRALQALQASIGSASGMLARGAGGAEFAGPGNPLDAGSRFAISVTNAITGGILGGLAESVTRSILGARSRVSDIGILIGGGVITDLVNGIEIGAYQQTQSRSWWGGSTRTREQVESLDDSVARQFELIIGNIVETVRQGALALGISAGDIESALESFRVEEIRISTMDLSAEEQQAELEAVFSTIFDGLAGHVVPFIAQFQQVGEGLGETLVRVATSVQVAQEAVRQLGFAMDTVDPETVAQISVELIELAGGIEEFITGLQTFVDKFAPESHKLEVAQDQLTRALDGVGLSLPGTREEMWELMQSLDATTESGRAQIAILLELAAVSDTYYTMLERGEEALERATQSYRDFIDGFAPSAALDDPIADIRRREREAIEHAHAMAEAAGMQAAATEDLAIISAWAEREIAAVQAQYAAGMVAYRDYIDTITDRRGYDSVRDAIEAERQSMIDRANDLARSAGMEGAATQDLARIHRWAAGQIAAATLRIRDEITRLVAELSSTGRFVPGQGYVEGAVSDFETGAGGAIERVGDAAQRMYQQQLTAIQRISDYLVSMQFGPLSALSPMEQLEAARSQLEVLQTAALAGDADAMAALPQAAQQYLQLLQGAYASGDEFGAGYEWVQQLLQAVVDQGPTVDDPGAGGAGTWDGYPGLTPDALRERDELLVAQEAEYRAALAGQLAEHLGQLAELVNAPVLELAGLLGITLDGLVADLGINLQDITGNAVLALADLADALGLSLGGLAGELGLELADLGGGITELLDRMGHSLDAITAETVTAMVGLGQMLGMSLGEITQALGLELTDLADGLTELTEGVGIDLGNLTTQSVAALAQLATDLGIDLGDLATAVGAEIGELTDSQSLLNQTFATQLANLPEHERDALQPLFDAVTTATSDADANAAIQELEDAVNGIGGAAADALAPYLAGVFPAAALTDLDYLGGIDTTARAMKSVLDNQLSSLNSVSSSTSAMSNTLDRVRNLLRAQNADAGLPTYASGGWVNARTTLVAGEAGRELILPNAVSEFFAREGIPFNAPAGGDPQLLAELRQLRAETAQLRAAVVDADHNNQLVTTTTGREGATQLSEALRGTTINRGVRGHG